MDFDEEDDREECLIMNRLAAVRRVKKLISYIYIQLCVSEVVKDVAQNLIHLQSYYHHEWLGSVLQDSNLL